MDKFKPCPFIIGGIVSCKIDSEKCIKVLIDRLRANQFCCDSCSVAACCGDMLDCVFQQAADTIESLNKQLVDLKLQTCSCFE